MCTLSLTGKSRAQLLHLMSHTVHQTRNMCHKRSHLSLLHSVVDFFVLLELLQLCLNQHLSDVHHLLYGQRQTLHGETELLLQQHKRVYCTDTHNRQWPWQRQLSHTELSVYHSVHMRPSLCIFQCSLCGSRLHLAHKDVLTVLTEERGRFREGSRCVNNWTDGKTWSQQRCRAAELLTNWAIIAWKRCVLPATVYILWYIPVKHFLI